VPFTVTPGRGEVAHAGARYRPTSASVRETARAVGVAMDVLAGMQLKKAA